MIELRGGFDLDPLARRVAELTPHAEDEGAQVILDAAQKLVPVVSGHLVGTGHIVRTQAGAGVKFDGPYAAYIEERMDLDHPHGGQAKFLETAQTTHKDEALGKAAEAIRRAL